MIDLIVFYAQCVIVLQSVQKSRITRIVLILFWKIGLNDSNNLEQQNRTTVLSEHMLASIRQRRSVRETTYTTRNASDWPG